MYSEKRSEPKRIVRLSRSLRLQRCAKIYRKHMENIGKEQRGTNKKIECRTRHDFSSDKEDEHRKKIKEERKKEEKRKQLNDYQKYVKMESGKEVYKNMTAEERFKAIGDSWQKYKKKESKKEKGVIK